VGTTKLIVVRFLGALGIALVVDIFLEVKYSLGKSVVVVIIVFSMEVGVAVVLIVFSVVEGMAVVLIVFSV